MTCGVRHPGRHHGTEGVLRMQVGRASGAFTARLGTRPRRVDVPGGPAHRMQHLRGCLRGTREWPRSITGNGHVRLGLGGGGWRHPCPPPGPRPRPGRGLARVEPGSCDSCGRDGHLGGGHPGGRALPPLLPRQRRRGVPERHHRAHRHADRRPRAARPDGPVRRHGRDPAATRSRARPWAPACSAATCT